ncbi:MAG: aspartate dehydrogenase [Candidatus Omnitrophota bacterium]
MKQKLKVGIVGCGAIGSYLAKNIQEKLSKEISLVGICDINTQAAKRLQKILPKKTAVYTTSTIIRKSDLIIEATSVSACQSLLIKVISAGKDILVMSVGALLKNAKLIEKAKRKGINIYVPSGALAGIDALKAAQLGTIKEVHLTTKKPAKSLASAPYIKKNRIDLSKICNDKLLFRGNAMDAVDNFPQNINVAATLSLATIGPAKTKVKIFASPHIKANIHEIMVDADCGRIITRTENLASKANPKTSYLAMLSALATLKGILNPIKIGT